MEHLNEYLDFIRTVEGIKSVTRTAWTKGKYGRTFFSSCAACSDSDR
jgi:hypothetical protein